MCIVLLCIFSSIFSFFREVLFHSPDLFFLCLACAHRLDFWRRDNVTTASLLSVLILLLLSSIVAVVDVDVGGWHIFAVFAFFDVFVVAIFVVNVFFFFIFALSLTLLTLHAFVVFCFLVLFFLFRVRTGQGYLGPWGHLRFQQRFYLQAQACPDTAGQHEGLGFWPSSDRGTPSCGGGRPKVIVTDSHG